MGAGEDKPQGFLLGYIRNFIKYWPGGSYLVMKSTPRVPGGDPLLAIGYNYNYMKFIGFIGVNIRQANQMTKLIMTRGIHLALLT